MGEGGEEGGGGQKVTRGQEDKWPIHEIQKAREGKRVGRGRGEGGGGGGGQRVTRGQEDKWPIHEIQKAREGKRVGRGRGGGGGGGAEGDKRTRRQVANSRNTKSKRR